jgi:hypothetical protein
MVTVEITSYGPKDAVIKKWTSTQDTMEDGLALVSVLLPQVHEHSKGRDVHFIDCHVHDHDQDARNR